MAASLFGWPTDEVGTIKMWHVYVLKGNSRKYVGVTSNLKRRITDHRRGQTHTTARIKNLKLIFCESFISKKDAYRQEKFYKTGYGKEVLNDKLKDTLKNYSEIV